ncbi:hypothetical protein PLIIFM63780_003155 [Purpureocillium lilacinum]|uniref:uncharacterized protein n=1 Tax=Purpureocillium lilacinum TaxID=33203 RepID=UPI002086DF37|nr:hypothetical protein PLICBS_004310 [Purpureocillium lilacinum]GJN79638.1 hypothetical protein PLIIFM63780_003155 [Purpureocillium lilacinum]
MKQTLFVLVVAYGATAHAALQLLRGTCYTDGCLVSEPIMGGKAAKVVPCRADFPCHHLASGKCALIHGQDRSMCNEDGVRKLQEMFDFLETPVECQQRIKVEPVS